MEYNDIINIINECFQYSTSDTSKTLSSVLIFCLDKICDYINADYGFIGEKMIDDNNAIFFRYFAVKGIPDGKYLNSYKKNGYIDFYNQTPLLHNKILETGKYVICNNLQHLPHGHPPMANFCAFPLKNNDNIIGIIGLSRTKTNVIHDFTDEDVKKIQPLATFIGNYIIHARNIENLEKHKMSFVANMSHEVRTPLNAIITIIDMIEKTELTDVQFNYIDSIKTCGIQLMDIVNDILDYSKIISSGLKLNLGPMSIMKCVKSVYTMMLSKAQEKNIEFTYNINNDVPDTIICDQIRFKQVLLNLVSNAIKFTKKGSIRVEIQVIEITDYECELLCYVKDTGIGIKQEKILNIFDTFRQIDNDYLSENSGTGLGLPISKHIVEKFNGKMWLDSKLNVGTTAQFTIKVKLFKNDISIEKIKNYFLNKNMLLIDNDLNEKIFLFNEMTKIGLKPLMSSSVDEALIYLSNNTFTFEFILINVNDIDEKSILKINRIKNHCVKVIIVDFDNSDKSIINYDYKLTRPINLTKLNELLSIIYIGIQYQSKNSHNEIFSNGYAHKISNINIEAEKEITHKNIRILVAEDNKQNQKVIVNLLNSMGWYDITITEDGLETFTKLTNEDFDIAFIDLKMPIMSGISAVVKFKEICSKDTVIIAVTASVTEDIKKRCFDAKMDGFIAKPIDSKDLEIIMNSIISSKFKTLFT